MKTFTTLLLCCILLGSKCALAQDDVQPLGYKMVVKQNLLSIQVYQDDNGAPNLDCYRNWNFICWFRCDPSQAKTVGGVTYVPIVIPETNNLIISTAWTKSGDPIGTSDYDQKLWILKADFEQYAVNYYPRFTSQLAFGGLTVPFRIRPAVKSTPSTIFNGDFNVGSYLGYRVSVANSFGISVVGAIGISSLSQNASNNTAITDNSGQSMFALTYGGGIIVDWAKKFQVGVIVGADNGFDKLSTTYLYQNKAWFAISLNYSFLTFTSASSNSQNASGTPATH